MRESHKGRATKRVITVESRRTDYRTSSVPAFPQQFEGVSKPYGLYHYSYATTPDEAVKEAKFFLRVISGLKPEYPVVFDLEDPSQAKLGKSTLTAIAKAFLSTV